VPHPVFAAAKLDLLDSRRAARGAAAVGATHRTRVAADLAALRREMEEAPPALDGGSQYLGVLRTHEDAGVAGGTPYANAQVKPTQWRKVNFYAEHAKVRCSFLFCLYYILLPHLFFCHLFFCLLERSARTGRSKRRT
jgi:hypothetical protein